MKIRTARRNAPSAFLIPLLFALAWPVASADAVTPCLEQEPPHLGDGPLVDDAPNGVPVPLVPGCYNGALAAGDQDEYQTIPRTAQFRVKSLEGCFRWEATQTLTGNSLSHVLCDGESIRLGVKDVLGGSGGQPLRLAFSDGPGVYWFLVE